jgi:hypothetical protein
MPEVSQRQASVTDLSPSTAKLRSAGSIIRRASAFRRNQDGSLAVEFAIIAPIFFFLMFVIAETALIFIAEQVMDNAVFEAARLVRTGQAQKGTWPNPDPDADPAPMTKADFREDVCRRMRVFIDCDSADFYLDVRSYDNFAAMNIAKPLDDDEAFTDEGNYDFGDPTDIVVVRAYYQWPTNRIYGNLSMKNMENGKRLIGSFAAFRNEPFSTN